MFEFHGWFSIAEAPDENDKGSLDHIIEELNAYLSSVPWPSGFFDLRPLNGLYCLYIAGAPNRRTQYVESLDRLLLLLAQKSPGSYGLLYIRDTDEAHAPGVGNFYVKVLSKGTVTIRYDPFLSPAVPTIEDA